MSEPQEPARPGVDKPAPTGQPPIVQAEQLFQGLREVWIQHAGVCYRLRITRRNKLILQK